jgi:hypothetical protein
VGALALSANPSLTNAQLVTLLETNSDDLGTPGFDQFYGYGRVNAYKAVAAAKGVATDTTPPKVSISSPLSGATVLGTVSVLGAASDNVGVTKVEFYVDGGLYASGTASAFVFSWISGTAANGSHTLTVKAYDAVGNVGSASIAVTVSNSDTMPPTVKISSPLPGATVSGTAVPVSGAASDNVGVTKVELYADGALYASATAPSFSFSWNSTTATNGSHTLMVKAYDAAKNAGSASISVNVSNTSGASTSPLLQLHADATEVTGVANGSTVTPHCRLVSGRLSSTALVRRTSRPRGRETACTSSIVTNTNNAYYKFSGTAVGNVFHASRADFVQPEITVHLCAAADQRGGSTLHVRREGRQRQALFFSDAVTSGSLQFDYSIDGWRSTTMLPPARKIRCSAAELS